MPASWKTVRVFISSTFKDMQAERDQLVRFVFPRLREELLKHRIHLVDVDLRWGVTSDQDALGVCREVIDECHPRFMGMLGGRYGWVPEGQEKSITADEIHYGVLSREAEQHGHAFFYFRDPKATADIIEETPGEYREPEGSDAALKLTALKQAITDAKLPVFLYPAHWDIAQHRLTGLEAFGNRVFNDLLQSCKDDPKLADHFSEQGTVTPDEFQEEADQMEAFIEERTDRYVIGSRDPLLRDMLAFAAADGTPNIFVLTGDPGSGKSALLAQFVRSPAFTRPEAPPKGGTPNAPLLIPHFIGASTGSTDLRRTLRRLCHELARAAGNTEPQPLDIKELITHFQVLLKSVGEKMRVILVFDALNQFDATDGAHWMNWLPRELPPGVRIIASVIAPVEGEKEHQTLAILRNRKDVRVEHLKPLSWRDSVRIMRGYLRRFSKRMDKAQKRALLAKPAGRLPLYVLTALEELRTLGTYEEITDRIRTLPGDARALFGWILTERLARDPGFRDRKGRPCGAALVEKFAACLGVSRHGLSPEELTALLDPGDPLGNVAALLRLLRPYLMRRGELLDFYHGQFREAAGAAHLDTPEKQRTAHQSVAICLQAFADPHRDGQYRDATPHALSELPHHQTCAEAWPHLITTLENIFFLEAKVTHGMVFDLAMDFTSAVEALPPGHVEQQRLRLLDEALRRDIHFIERHAKDYPQALFQCLWNSAWWYDSSEAANHYVDPEGGWRTPPPWQQPRESRLSTLLESWLVQKERVQSPLIWLRNLRPPSLPLGSGQLAVLCGHEGPVRSVAFSAADRRALSGSDDKTIRVWDAQSGQELAVLRGHESGVTSVAVSPDGRWVLSGSMDQTLRLWEAESGRELAVFNGHDDCVNTVAFSRDGCQVLSGSRDKTLRLWAVNGTRELAVLREHHDCVNSAVFSPDGRRMLSGSDDKTLRLWDAQNWRELAVLRGHERWVSSVAYSADGRSLLSGSRSYLCDSENESENTLRLWDVHGLRELAVFRGHADSVNSVAFSPDGCRILSGSDDKTVRLWDAQNGRALEVLCGHEDSVNSVAFSSDGCRILSGSDDGTVRLWGTRSSRELGVLRGHDDPVTSVAFSPDGRCLHTRSVNKLQFWDTVSGRELAVLRGLGRMESKMMGVPLDGHRTLLVLEDKSVQLWDAQNGVRLELFQGEGSFTSFLTGAALLPWQAITRNHETVIQPSTGGSPVAWSSNALAALTTHPGGRLWAGVTSRDHIVLLRLEGG